MCSNQSRHYSAHTAQDLAVYEWRVPTYFLVLVWCASAPHHGITYYTLALSMPLMVYLRLWTQLCLQSSRLLLSMAAVCYLLATFIEHAFLLGINLCTEASIPDRLLPWGYNCMVYSFAPVRNPPGAIQLKASALLASLHETYYLHHHEQLEPIRIYDIFHKVCKTRNNVL